MQKSLDLLFCFGVFVGTMTVGGAVAVLLECVLRLM